MTGCMRECVMCNDRMCNIGYVPGYGNPVCSIAANTPSASDDPPISCFIVRMGEAGFRLIPPVSKQTPLPTKTMGRWLDRSFEPKGGG